MRKHKFDSHLVVSNYNKEGLPRLRVSVPIEAYRVITEKDEVKFLRRMILNREDGEKVTMKYPRISKGTTNGNYAPHYITVSAEDVKKYGFKAKEQVKVTVEWDD